MDSYIRQLHNLCICHSISICVAESCTSGKLATSISSLPKSSSYFKGGIIAYQNIVKIEQLDIPSKIIEKETAVSREVASAMAINVCKKFRADFSLATSGYAGPSGGTRKNPIGVVYIAVADKQGNIITERYFFKGTRSYIIHQATYEAIKLLYGEIKKIS